MPEELLAPVHPGEILLLEFLEPMGLSQYALAKAIGDHDPMAVLSGAHREIFHLVRLLRRQIGALAGDAADADDLRDIRRVLYGLHAILALHMDQEEEVYQTISDPAAGKRPATIPAATGS